MDKMKIILFSKNEIVTLVIFKLFSVGKKIMETIKNVDRKIHIATNVQNKWGSDIKVLVFYSIFTFKNETK